MLSPWVLAVLLLSLSATPPSAPEDTVAVEPPAGSASAAIPALTYTGKPFPPKGSPADQELIEGLLQAQAGVLSERAIAVKLSNRLAAARYDSRLASLEGSERPDEAARTGDLRKRLYASWSKVSEIMNAKWLVDPRLGCRKTGVELEALMGAAPSDSASAQLPLVRSKARACLDTQLLMLRPLEKANRDLQAVVSEVKSTLASAPNADAREPHGRPEGGAIGNPVHSGGGGL
jgi:hypothetical protein